jgi:hypothetical protein
MRRPAGPASILLVLGLFLTVPGCSQDQAKSCQPPPSEDALLAAYTADAVFTIRPPEAIVSFPPTTDKACRRDRITATDRAGRPVTALGPNSATTAYMSIRLNLGFTEDQLTALYDPQLHAEGWIRQPSDAPTENTRGRQVDLVYCKPVNSVPTIVDVEETYLDSDDRRDHQSGTYPSPDNVNPEEGDIEITMVTATLGHC